MEKKINNIVLSNDTDNLAVLFAKFQIWARQFGLTDCESYAWICVGMNIKFDYRVTQDDYESAVKKLGNLPDVLHL